MQEVQKNLQKQSDNKRAIKDVKQKSILLRLQPFWKTQCAKNPFN